MLCYFTRNKETKELFKETLNMLNKLELPVKRFSEMSKLLFG